jgi:predicted hotdog family 3-hydroxylacyl-ACP dehydratase
MTEAELSSKLSQLIGMPVAEFVLHREPMLLLDQLVSAGPEFTACEWRVSEESEFLIPNVGVPAYTGIEYMAQCIAVHAGMRERICGFPPSLGLLLGTRYYKARVSCFKLATTYRVECKELAWTHDGLGSFECGILLNDQLIANAQLAVLQRQQGKVPDE